MLGQRPTLASPDPCPPTSTSSMQITALALQPTLAPYPPTPQGHLCDALLAANLPPTYADPHVAGCSGTSAVPAPGGPHQLQGQGQGGEGQQGQAQQGVGSPGVRGDVLGQCVVLGNAFSTYQLRWGTGGRQRQGRGGGEGGAGGQPGPKRPDTMLRLLEQGGWWGVGGGEGEEGGRDQGALGAWWHAPRVMHAAWSRWVWRPTPALSELLRPTHSLLAPCPSPPSLAPSPPPPPPMWRPCAGRVVEVGVPDGRDFLDVPSAFNDAALHAFIPHTHT